MPDELTSLPLRAPVVFTCDASTPPELARALTAASLLSPGIWPLAAVAGIAAAGLGLAVHSWVAALIMGVLTAVGLAMLVHKTNTKAMRRMAGPGAVMTSGYDDHPRLVISSGAGATGLDAGSVRRITRRGEATILTLSTRRMRLVTPSALITEADAAFWTARGLRRSESQRRPRARAPCGSPMS